MYNTNTRILVARLSIIYATLYKRTRRTGTCSCLTNYVYFEWLAKCHENLITRENGYWAHVRCIPYLHCVAKTPPLLSNNCNLKKNYPILIFFLFSAMHSIGQTIKSRYNVSIRRLSFMSWSLSSDFGEVHC